VKANNGGDSAVAVGDQIFYTAVSTPKLDKAATGKPFGVALEAIGSGETATIQVRLNGFYFPDGAIGADGLADGAVTLAKLDAIARGSVIVGGDGNAPTALDAKASGQILVGDGTDLKSVPVTGDVTIGATGETTIGAGKVDQRQTDNTHTYETFNASPVVSQVSAAAGAAPDGGDEDVTAMCLGRNMFEYCNYNAQTLLAPTLAADGLLCSLDLTATDGVEYGQGITARSKHAYTVGTSAAWYLKVGLKIVDVSGLAECAVGFRKTDAYNDALDDYTDVACLNVQGGTINIETILNGEATVATDTTKDWADNEEHVLEVYCTSGGVVTYKIDGDAPTKTAAFTFDNTDTVIPFLYIIQDTDTSAVYLQSWECGYQ
jgi:hypothetical protein